jgi:Carboxypeptidase regulatory-like domain
MRKAGGPIALLFAFWLVCAACCWAQFNGNLSGAIQDPSGLAISGASIKLTNVATKVTTSVTSDSQGNFRFVSLAPGSYEIEASASGFSTVRVPFTLDTDQTLNVPIRMQVKSVAASIEVTAEAPVLNTSDSRTQMTLENQAVENLPLQGRNMISLVTLAPGVTGLGLVGGSPGSAADNYSTETQVDASANGRGSVGNMYVVDGMDVTSDIRPGVLNLTPNPDSIQETSIQADTYSVEYGRASSIQMVLTSKSGTNAFHGLASDYFTYQGLWAGTEFVHTYAPFHSNNISAAIGGPIIPHHEFFFFFSIEPLRSSASTGNAVNTFEAAQFTSWAEQNFPNTLGTTLLKTYPPSGATVTGVAETANQIFPGTCGTSATFNLPCSTPMIDTGIFNATGYRNGLQWNTRIDKYFSKDRVYGNVYRTTLNTGGPSIRPSFAETDTYVTDSAQGNETHTFSPSTLNEVMFGYNKVQGITPASGLFTVPSIGINGQGVGFGDGFALGDFIQHNYHWRDVLTHIHGSHTMRFGYEGRHGDDLALFAPVYEQPSFSFNNLLQFVQDIPYSESGLSYNPLTGNPQAGQYEYAVTIHGLFAEDTWKIHNRLTLTYGLRWDDFGNPYPLAGTTLADFHLGPGLNLDQQIANGFMLQQSNVFNHAIADVFSPRAGVAWDPTGRATWVIRGGFGIFHDWPTLGNDENGLKGNPPGWVVPTFFSVGATAAPIFALGTRNSPPFGFPYPAFVGTTLDSHGGLTGSQISVGGIDANLSSPVTYNYTATVERKLVGNTVVSAGYSGSQSRNLITGGGQVTATSYGTDINRFAGDLIVNDDVLTRLNHSFGSITYAQNGAQGSYNALIVGAHGRFGAKGYFNASYTRSKSTDDSQIYPTFTNLSQYLSPSVWDAPNRFALSLSYELPGTNSAGAFVDRVTSGWVISEITLLQSGYPFVVSTNAPFEPIFGANGAVIGMTPQSGDYSADGFNYAYPDVTSYAQGTSRHAYLTGVFSAGQFPQPALGQEGDEQPNRFRDPGYADSDISLQKNTRLAEQLNLQFRFDFFNIFNRPNLTGMDSNLPDGTFGQATSQFNPRWLQLGLKLNF